MPSSSKKQADFMAAVANNPAFAKKAGVPQSVGKEFNQADKGRKFSKGGDMKHDAMKKGMPAALAKHAAKPASKAHKGLMAGGKVGYADGGMPMTMKGGKKVPSFAADGVGKMKSGGMAGMHKMPDGKMMKDSAMKHGGMAKMAAGGATKMGSVRTNSKPDGIAMKGKTKGAMVKMARGGKAC